MNNDQIMQMRDVKLDSNLGIKAEAVSAVFSANGDDLFKAGNDIAVKQDAIGIAKNVISDFPLNDLGLGKMDAHMTGWEYWQDWHYPRIIRESYPVYIQERSQDKGKEAFEIIKMLKDKKFLSPKNVGEFIDLMDELIKIL